MTRNTLGHWTENMDIAEPLLKERTASYLKKAIGGVLQIAPDKINSSEPLTTYGLDSMRAVQIMDVLRESFNQVSSTLLFEHHSVDALIDHFIRTERHAVLEVAGLKILETVALDPGAAATTPVSTVVSKVVQWMRQRQRS